MSSDFNFNIEREVEQLRIAIEFHEQQIGRLESRIRELQEEQDDLTQISGVDDRVALLLAINGFETIDDLRRATEHEIAIASESSVALGIRIKADVGELVVCADEDCKATSDQYEDLLQDDIEYCPYHQDEDDDEEEVRGLDDIFEPEDKFPPQFHFDNLNIQLDYDIEQADGFFDLSWKEQCDLVQLAADNDLELTEVETILDLRSDAGDSDE